jgi:hypothetical protein
MNALIFHHGHPATLNLEQLWIRDATIMTGRVDAREEREREGAAVGT